ncbi:MAG: hypothetical protein DRI77_00085 [Chloroflexi bacterium]|nr:MAG: hypothetical protein DRI77_00085 [Chloroflexota bacterium]
MQSVVASFILAKRADGRAPRTIHDYHRCLDPFADWCTDQSLSLDNLTRSDVRRYVVRLRSNKCCRYMPRKQKSTDSSF